MYKNAVFIVAQLNFHNAEVWFWRNWVLKYFTFANVLWREPIHLLLVLALICVAQVPVIVRDVLYLTAVFNRWPFSESHLSSKEMSRLKQKTKNHALHTGSIEMLDLVSCINPIIYGVYYFSERNFRPRRTSTMRWGFHQPRLDLLVWFSSTRATRIKLSQQDIFQLFFLSFIN